MYLFYLIGLKKIEKKEKKEISLSICTFHSQSNQIYSENIQIDMDCNDFNYTLTSMHTKYAMMVSLLKGIEQDVINLEKFNCHTRCMECSDDAPKKITKEKSNILKNSLKLIGNHSIEERDGNVLINTGERIVKRPFVTLKNIFEDLPEKAVRNDFGDTSRAGHYMRYYALSSKFNAVLIEDNNKMTLVKTKD